MAGDIRKALEIISRHAAIAQGNRSFGHLRPKIGGDASLGIEDGEELGEGDVPGMPAKAATPGAELNAAVQDHVLDQQDHQMTDDSLLPGALEHEEEEDKPRIGIMSTNRPRVMEAHGIAETARKRRGRPRGSRA